MATQTTQVIPPAHVGQIGIDFAQSFLGTQGLDESPFYVDPASWTGQDFVAAQDPLITQAQGMVGGLGDYTTYLDNAAAAAQQSTNLVIDPATGIARPAAGADALTQAGIMASQAQQAAIAGQDAGATGLASAQAYANLMGGAAIAGQGAGDPYLQAAAGYVGPQAYEQFMSPYQQQVIDASMAQYNQDLQQQMSQLGTSAGNAFGGGRFGVAQGEMAAQGALGGAQLGAGLRQQGFMDASNLASQAYQQQMGMGTQAMTQAAQNVGMYADSAAQQLNQATANQTQAAQNQALYGTAQNQQTAQATAQQAQLTDQLSGLGGITATQQGLGQYDVSMLGNQINAMTQMGQISQQHAQTLKDALARQKKGTAMAGTSAMEAMSNFMAAAYGNPAYTSTVHTPDPSSTQTALGAGMGLLGLIGGATSPYQANPYGQS